MPSSLISNILHKLIRQFFLCTICIVYTYTFRGGTQSQKCGLFCWECEKKQFKIKARKSLCWSNQTAKPNLIMEYNILINIIKNSSTINLMVILCVTINRFVFYTTFGRYLPKYNQWTTFGVILLQTILRWCLNPIIPYTGRVQFLTSSLIASREEHQRNEICYPFF